MRKTNLTYPSVTGLKSANTGVPVWGYRTFGNDDIFMGVIFGFLDT